MANKERWIVTTPELKIAPNAKLFAPALKSAYEHPGYLEVFEHYCLKGLSIRYSGAFSVDCYQMFIKGNGCYSMIDSCTHPSRLHLIYLVIPVAFLIEKAGGKTSDGTQSLLDVVIDGFSQKVTFVAGSSNDVDYILKALEMEKKEKKE
jgi:sedoheptulose-bisphosphatase